MATAILPNTTTSNSLRMPVDDRHGWGYALLLALIATLFLRPADLIPALDDWPIYQSLIVVALVVAARGIARLLDGSRLVDEPVTASLVVLLAAVGMSHLAHGFLWGARASMFEFGKLLALYLLVVGVVNTPRRLSFFLRWLVFSIMAVATLSILDYYEVISLAIEAIEDRSSSSDSAVVVERIRGTGIFQDPNDFGLVLVTGSVLCAGFLFNPQTGLLRYLWLVPCGILLFTLSMTQSRGAFLSLLSAIPALSAYYRGGKLGVWVLLALPVLGVLFSGRMTDVSSINVGTGQSRIQIWSDTLSVFRTYPLFGLGEGLLSDELGVVAHNSFLHCFAELGIFGGTAFLSCFLAGGLGLWSLRSESCRNPERHLADSEDEKPLFHMRGFVFAALIAYAVGILTISRHFIAPTYLVLGLATATHTLLAPSAAAAWRVGNRFLAVCLITSAASILLYYMAVRVLVRW